MCKFICNLWRRKKGIHIHSKLVEWKEITKQQKMDWGIKALRVHEVWKTSRGEGVKVAILDTGVSKHDDLGINIEKGVNFTSADAKDYEDRVGHGTHVAGIVAAADNDIGVVGVAPNARIYVGKVLGDNGSGSFDWIIRGIDWAIAERVDIISMSLGSNMGNEELHAAVKRAYDKNITVVAAAGNDGDEYDDSDNIDYPGRYPEAIAVGAVNKYLKRSWFSSNGEKLEIAAPGEDITSTYLKNGYAVLSGTSMATPFVSGVLALLIAKHKNNDDNKTPIDTPARIREHLIRTADDAGEIGKDRFYGYGIISPTKLMEGVSISSLYM
jgi:subtilisin family serine protease